VPTAYVINSFDVKLDYPGRPRCTVKFELGHNEIGDADEPEFHMASDLTDLFTDVGLPAPKPVPVMRADPRITRKFPAVSGERRRLISGPASSRGLRRSNSGPLTPHGQPQGS
jgi:hypothetical protein